MELARASNHHSATAGTLRGFNLFGVPVRLHFTFILLIVFLAVTGLGSGQAMSSYALFLAGLFASVLLHETGHAAIAGRFGVRTTEIIMFPIGGVSRMERMLKPKEELFIALAGPLVNLLLSAAIFFYMFEKHIAVPAKPGDLLTPTDANALARLACGNLLLAGFNLLPAFPMDGGRILRALLSFIRPEDQATRTAAWMGRMLAISMGLYGLLYSHFLLVFVAFFVYLGAAQESAAALGRTLTTGIPVRAAMLTEYHTLTHGHTIRDAANLLLATSQQDFPIVHSEQVVGLLGRNALLRAMANDGPDAYVAGYMDREYTTLKPDMNLAEVLPLMAHSGACALVMDGEHLMGLLTAENLSQFLLLRRFGW